MIHEVPISARRQEASIGRFGPGTHTRTRVSALSHELVLDNSSSRVQLKILKPIGENQEFRESREKNQKKNHNSENFRCLK